jgi:hypothetical protein
MFDGFIVRQVCPVCFRQFLVPLRMITLRLSAVLRVFGRHAIFMVLRFFREATFVFVNFFFLFLQMLFVERRRLLFLFFFEGRSANQTVGFGVSLGLFMLGFDNAGGKRRQFVFAQACRAIVMVLAVSFLFVLLHDGCGSLLRKFGSLGFGYRFTCRSRFCFLIRQNPVRQAS